MILRNMSDDHFALCLLTGLFTLVVVIVNISRRLRPGHNVSIHRKAVELYKQCKKWHALACQDSQPLVILRHSNFASAYLESARLLISDDALQQVTSGSVHSLKKSIEMQQTRAFKMIKNKNGKLEVKGISPLVWID